MSLPALRATRVLATALFALALPLAGARADDAETAAALKRVLEQNPQLIKSMLRELLVQNPEILQEANMELLRRRTAAEAASRAAVIAANAELVFRSSRDGAYGKAAATITLVEFFDYNCGPCKRATADAMALVEADPRVRIVLKEFPVLGPGSQDAARVAAAVRLADPDGESYLRFHKLLAARAGSIGKVQALAAAIEAGLDAGRIEAAMSSAQVNDTLEATRRLAGQLGIRATPSFVIGDTVVVGAAGVATLRQRLAALPK
jgi:protein-disulfide isomerase